jgi:membrane-bound metal-dependent hydrolase YbcI (DUF457 family)
MRTVSLALAVYAFMTDAVTGWHAMGFVGRGLLDEPAHLATALVVFGAIVRFRRGAVPDPRFCWAMLLSSVLIDLDHVPAELGTNAFTNGTARPYTHALWTVLVLTLAALVVRYRRTRRARPAGSGLSPGTAELVLGGAAAGVAAHFLRDIATAGMAVWWPLTDMPVQVPYWWYALALLVTIALPVSPRLRPGPANHRRVPRSVRQPASRRRATRRR